MSYTLQAIIGFQKTLGDTGSDPLVTVALTDALRMVPLATEVRKRHHIPYLPLIDDQVAVLPHSLDLLCRKLSRHGLVAYLEAEFFGGIGEQAHVLFENGTALGSPVIAKDAINQALRCFAIVPGGHHDEFAAVGLGRFRHTDAWTNGSSPQPPR